MENLKNRKLISKIFSFIDDKETIVIHGSRQVGKTSILSFIINRLKTKSDIHENNIFYFDLEDFNLLDLCNSGVVKTASFLKGKGADFSKKIYFFIDEIQYLNNPSSFLKLFHDRYEDKIKLIVSGSSSFQIKKKFKDSLAGRIIDFELFPLDFDEFLEFKGVKYDLTADLPDMLKNEINDLYKEFILYGGYPAIVLENVIEKKEIKLKQIINAYIKKDIKDLAEIRQIDKFNNLIKVLAAQTSGLLNVLELSNTVGLAKQTIEEYLFLLENTYIIKRIKPFHKNIRSELTKMPKIYFEDTGIANILANKTFLSEINGALFENSIYTQLRKNLNVEDLYFWRTNKQQEIDFVVEFIDKNKTQHLSTMEVKINCFNKYLSALKYFKSNYTQAQIYCCYFDKKENPKNKDITMLCPWQIPYIFK